MSKSTSKDNLERILREGTKELGILLSKEKIILFHRYMEELKEWNKGFNLTSITEDREIIIKHFIDSLTLLRFLKPSWKLLDIGSGAGFPGVPLKIVMPELKVTLLEAKEKKVFFLRHIIRTFGLKGIDALYGRAEDMAKKKELRETFDIVVSRALSSLKDFISIGLPFVKEGGILSSIKGKNCLRETEMLNLPNVKPIVREIIKPPFSDRETVILVYQKVF
ncbi:MAG: 16S rRNA (guanine(527)-N(7))-methyltransferase RsmG [Thermodesulfobacteriota bacterium]